MSTQASALVQGEPGGEDEYQAFYAVLAAAARGRAFLDEHARRTRHAETDVLLAALKRLENQVAAQTSAPLPASSVLAEVGAVLEMVRSACARIDAVQLSATVTQLALALETVQRRLAPLLPSTPNAAERQPAPVQPPFAITAAAAPARASTQPEEEPVRVIKAGSMPPPPVFGDEDFSAAVAEIEESAADLKSAALPSPSSEEDPLGLLMALSEEERLALFS